MKQVYIALNSSKMEIENMNYYKAVSCSYIKKAFETFILFYFFGQMIDSCTLGKWAPCLI